MSMTFAAGRAGAVGYKLRAALKAAAPRLDLNPGAERAFGFERSAAAFSAAAFGLPSQCPLFHGGDQPVAEDPCNNLVPSSVNEPRKG